jgi:hypothetical protein
MSPSERLTPPRSSPSAADAYGWRDLSERDAREHHLAILVDPEFLQEAWYWSSNNGSSLAASTEEDLQVVARFFFRIGRGAA